MIDSWIAWHLPIIVIHLPDGSNILPLCSEELLQRLGPMEQQYTQV